MTDHLIEVYAYIVAYRTGAGSVHDPKAFSDFVIPNWETDIQTIEGSIFNFRLERLVRAEGPNPMGKAAEIVRQEGIITPEGWSISSIEIKPHISFGEVDEDPSGSAPKM